VIVSPQPIVVINRIMKPAVYSKTKSGKLLQILDADTPIPKESEVLLRVRVASINPLDWRLKSRQPGVDVAGQVVAVGKRITQFKAGDAVFGTQTWILAKW
jgi:NADPH:quinone reductase-like Zn-dependent oxidoreductase